MVKPRLKPRTKTVSVSFLENLKKRLVHSQKERNIYRKRLAEAHRQLAEAKKAA